MKKINYQSPTFDVIVTDYCGVLCESSSKGNGLGGYYDDVTPDYGEDD